MAKAKTTPKKATAKKSLVKRVVDKITKSVAKPIIAEAPIASSSASTPVQKLAEYAKTSRNITKEQLIEFGFSESELPTSGTAIKYEGFYLKNRKGYEIIK